MKFSLLLVNTAVIVGCEAAGDAADGLLAVDPCTQGTGNKDVTGTWQFEGSSWRADCVDTHLNSDDVRMRMGPIAFQSDVATGTLSLGPNPSRGSSVAISSAQVTGSCVRFTVDDGDNHFSFDGKHQSDGRIVGEYTIRGPATCRGEGSFTATKNN